MTAQEKIQAGLAALFVTGFFGMMIALLFVDVPEGNVRVLDVLLGALAGTILTIATYHYGSSVGSKAKQQMIDKVMDKIGK